LELGGNICEMAMKSVRFGNVFSPSIVSLCARLERSDVRFMISEKARLRQEKVSKPSERFLRVHSTANEAPSSVAISFRVRRSFRQGF